MKRTRADIASFSKVYRETWQALKEAGSSVGYALGCVLLIPVHLLLWLWLPELSPEERERRERSRREWADADF